MPRRLPLTIALVALAALLGGAGCADTVSPAAKIGDRSLSHDDVLAEVEAWATSPTLLQLLQIPFDPGTEEEGYSTQFVDLVLSNRIGFELHHEEFDARELDLSDDELEIIRRGLPPEMLDELGEEYADDLVADIARQSKVEEALGADYAAWAQEAYTRDDIEVSSRYGGWDRGTGTILAPTPPSGPGGSQLLEL